MTRIKTQKFEDLLPLFNFICPAHTPHIMGNVYLNKLKAYALGAPAKKIKAQGRAFDVPGSRLELPTSGL
jgi:hypothetical protein